MDSISAFFAQYCADAPLSFIPARARALNGAAPAALAAALLEDLLRQQPALRRSSFSAAHAALQMNDGCLFVRCPSGLLQLLIAYCPQTARAWYQLAVNC